MDLWCEEGTHTDGMEHGILMQLTEFVLVGLSQTHKVQLILFFLFLLFHIIMLPANFFIILTMQGSPPAGLPHVLLPGQLGLLLLLCQPSKNTGQLLLPLQDHRIPGLHGPALLPPPSGGSQGHGL
ncbi:unnamed protein product [Eretmochelys imbricata]